MAKQRVHPSSVPPAELPLETTRLYRIAVWKPSRAMIEVTQKVRCSVPHLVPDSVTSCSSFLRTPFMSHAGDRPVVTEQANRHTAGVKGRAEFFSSLRYPNYRYYWFGQLFSVLAFNMELVTQSWLVLQITDSPSMLGLAGLAFGVPRVLLVLLGGVVADRTDRRQIMLITQSTAGLLFFIMGTLIVTGHILVWHVFVFAFLSGFLRTFDRPSRYALLPLMVPKEEIPNAVALGSSVWQSCRLVGPAVAGTMIFLLGVGQTFYFCFFSSVVAVLLWTRIKTGGTTRGEAGGVLDEILAGVNFIRHNQVFYTLLGLTFFNSIFGMSYVILMPIFARDILDAGSRGYGLLQSSTGVGSLLGTLLVAYLARYGRKGWQTLIGSATFGVLIVVFAFSQSYSLSLLLVFVLGLSNQLYLVSINTILQVRLPDALRGRVLGLYGLTWDLMPVGGAVAGVIAEYAGAPVAVALGGFMVALMAFWVLAYLPRVRRIE